MTWVIAKEAPLGNVTILSDTQISWHTSNKPIYKDCVQKVYPLSKNCAIAFAGSVDIGFSLVESAFNCIHGQNLQQTVNHTINIRAFVNKWHREANYKFKVQNRIFKDLGCELIVAGIDNVECNGNTRIPKTRIYTLRSKNNFEPVEYEGLRPASIGSGSKFKSYVSAIESIGNLKDPTIFNSDIMMISAFNAVHRNPLPGVGDKIQQTILSLNWPYQRYLHFSISPGLNKYKDIDMNELARTKADYQKVSPKGIAAIA